MNKDILLSFGILAIIIIGITGFIILFIALLNPPANLSIAQNLTFEKCCGGNMCTDVYYSDHDNKCHSTFEDFHQWPSFWPAIAVMVVGVLITFILYLYQLNESKIKDETSN